MKLSAIFTSVVAAAATVNAVPAEVSEAQAETQIAEVKAAGCDVGACIAALAPTAAVCAGALAEPTFAGELACLAMIWNGEVNVPSACNGC